MKALKEQIEVLRAYQEWRTGKDGRTIGEAGIVPSEITAALNAVMDAADGYEAGWNDALEAVKHKLKAMEKK